jgi:hypothetical protein
MMEERKKVLEMLAEGKITPDEAERLLEKLSASAAHGDAVIEEEQASVITATAGPGILKYLRVVVDSADGDKANIRVPIALLRTGINLATMMPGEAGEKLAAKGIDLSHLSSLKGEELIAALRDLKVDVDASDGTTVRIFCE